MSALPKLVAVLGPTACGKSGLGVALARRFDGEVVSADSRQVYRGLDLGTGKVTPEEMEGVPHHMLDVVEPGQPYSVADFQAGAYAALDNILARGKVPFLVGGTGLYLRAVTEGFVFSDAPPDPDLRNRLESLSTTELRTLVEEKTGAALSGGEENNRQRLIRAAEKVLSGGWETPPAKPRYHCLLLGVTYPRQTVCDRIDQRLQARIDAGMIDEVANLRAAGVSDEFLDRLGLEYRFILHFLQGDVRDLEELKILLGTAIKQFAKRQMSWFRKDKNVLWLDMEADPIAQAAQAVSAFLSQN